MSSEMLVLQTLVELLLPPTSLPVLTSHPSRQQGIFFHEPGNVLLLRPSSVNPRDGCDVVKMPVDL